MQTASSVDQLGTTKDLGRALCNRVAVPSRGIQDPWHASCAPSLVSRRRSRRLLLTPNYTIDMTTKLATVLGLLSAGSLVCYAQDNPQEDLDLAAPDQAADVQAQDSSDEATAEAKVEANQPTQPMAQEHRLHDVRKLQGIGVENPEGEQIADIEQLLVNEKGQIQFVILGTGGFLDLGERLIAIPWEALSIVNRAKQSAPITETDPSVEPAPAQVEAEAFVAMIDATDEQLADAPEYKEADRKTLLSGDSSQVYTYWGFESPSMKADSANSTNQDKDTVEVQGAE